MNPSSRWPRTATRARHGAGAGFVADCLETPDEIGNELEEEFHEAGGETLTYIPCLNDSDAGMKVIESWQPPTGGLGRCRPAPARRRPETESGEAEKAG